MLESHVHRNKVIFTYIFHLHLVLMSMIISFLNAMFEKEDKDKKNIKYCIIFIILINKKNTNNKELSQVKRIQGDVNKPSPSPKLSSLYTTQKLDTKKKRLLVTKTFVTKYPNFALASDENFVTNSAAFRDENYDFYRH